MKMAKSRLFGPRISVCFVQKCGEHLHLHLGTGHNREHLSHTHTSLSVAAIPLNFFL